MPVHWHPRLVPIHRQAAVHRAVEAHCLVVVTLLLVREVDRPATEAGLLLRVARVSLLLPRPPLGILLNWPLGFVWNLRLAAHVAWKRLSLPPPAKPCLR